MPYNSPESEEDLPIYDSNSSDEIKIDETAVKKDPSMKVKLFDKNILSTNPFRLESIRTYPYRAREGEPPLLLLKKPDIEFIKEIQPKLWEQ